VNKKVLIISMLVVLAMTAAFASFDEKLFHGGSSKLWVMTEFRLNGQLSPLPEWLQDNVQVINSDGTAFYIHGEIDRFATDTTTTDDIYWKIVGDYVLFEDQEYLFGDHPTTEGKIIALDEYHYVLEMDYLMQDTTQVVTAVYERLVVANPSAHPKNLALTNGSVKIWKMVDIKWNGESQPEIPWFIDDWMIFCTDGTGWLLKGEEKIHDHITGTPIDYSNNIEFYWALSDNNTSLHMMDYENSEFIMNLTQYVKQLDENTLVYESFGVVGGERGLMTVTLVPVIKK